VPTNKEGDNIMRNIQMSGRVANFGKVFKEAEGEKSAFCVVFLNMSLDRKDEESGYTATVPVKVTANGYWAERLNSFASGEMVYLTGKLDKENDWTNQEGELVKGGLYVRCEMIDNWAANADNAQSAGAGAKTAPAKPGAKKAPAKPAGKKPARPSMA
jgi:hypothetical protein